MKSSRNKNSSLNKNAVTEYWEDYVQTQTQKQTNNNDACL